MKKAMSFVAAMLISASAAAQQINLVVPFNTGGITDIFARMLQTELVADNKVAVVINKPGAEGIIGINEVIAQKSGETSLLIAVPGSTVVPASVNDEFAAKFNSLVPVIQLTYNHGMIVASKASGIKSMDQLTAELATRNINAGSASALTRAIYQIIIQNKQNLNLIPFNGEGPVVTQLLGGHIDIGWLTVNGANLQQVSSGNVIGLATSSTKRSINGLPVIKEASTTLPTPFVGVFAAPGTSDAARNQMNLLLAKLINQPSMVEFYAKNYFEKPDDTSAQAFSELLNKQMKQYKSVLTKK